MTDIVERGVDPCPLCGATDARLLERTPYESIWDSYAELTGEPLDAELRASLTPVPDANRVACGRCGLEYFTPLNPGPAAFYAALSSSFAYYPKRRWDYTRAARLASASDRVLDIGCGDGAFLRMIRPSVASVHGVDSNPDAVARLNESGIDASGATFSDFAAAHAEEFTFVTAFQVLEHLPQTEELASALRRCLAPGGLAVLAVPNAERLRLNPLDPLDFPPHHVSRWHPEQLRRFVTDLGFEPIGLWRELRGPGTVVDAWPTISRRARAVLHRDGSTDDRPPTAVPGRSNGRSVRAMLPLVRRLPLDHSMLIAARRTA